MGNTMSNIHSIAEIEVKRLKEQVERYRTMIQALEEENAGLHSDNVKMYQLLAPHPSRPQ